MQSVQSNHDLSSHATNYASLHAMPKYSPNPVFSQRTESHFIAESHSTNPFCGLSFSVWLSDLSTLSKFCTRPLQGLLSSSDDLQNNTSIAHDSSLINIFFCQSPTPPFFSWDDMIHVVKQVPKQKLYIILASCVFYIWSSTAYRLDEEFSDNFE